jgi:hypothetical protein
VYNLKEAAMEEKNQILIIDIQESMKIQHIGTKNESQNTKQDKRDRRPLDRLHLPLLDQRHVAIHCQQPFASLHYQHMHTLVTHWHAFVDSDGDASSFLLANSYSDRLLHQARLMVLNDMAVDKIKNYGCLFVLVTTCI